MLHMTRRHLFAGAAAVGAAAALPIGGQTANAATPAAKGTGVYRYKFGDVEVVQLMDGARTFPVPDHFVADVSKDEAIKAAAAAYMPDGKVTIPFTPTLVNTGSKLILIDTGNGQAAHAASKGVVGQMTMNMLAAGFDPKQIDIVIITHGHLDHINGLKDADGKPVFPNAELKIPAAEYAYWTNDANAEKANPYNKGVFAAVKKGLDGLKFTQYEGGKEVAPGLTSVSTPGHTPGHMSFVLASGSKRMLIQADVTNIPSLFLRYPDWAIMFDNDGKQAAETRHKFYDMAAAEKLLVSGYHFPYPCVGYVEKDGAKNYRLVPVAWDPNG
jgi:glyoxylase-like metal-dependent hydrolase (beta-lactamase superfamily II)